ncbi:MAG: hypothetical protein AAF479_16420 [Pseudomonadota bacterium]
MNAILPISETVAAPIIATLVLVDDSEIENRITQRTLERSGAVRSILSFHYIEDALAYLRSENTENVNVVLVDEDAPGFEPSGIRTAIGNHSGTADAPIVLFMTRNDKAQQTCGGLTSPENALRSLAKPLRTADIRRLAAQLGSL